MSWKIRPARSDEAPAISALGRGLGRALFAHACNLARRAQIRSLTIQSDPNAAGFYAALGARFLRDIPSSIPGRSIPCFEFDLAG